MIFDRKVLLAVTFSAGVFFRAAAAAEGKSTKGTKSQSNPIPLYFLNPSSCPQKCAQCRRREVDDDDGGHGTGEAVQPCDAENKHQMWRLHQKDGLTMIESVFNSGDCLAVVPQVPLGRRRNLMTMCMNGALSGLVGAMYTGGDGWDGHDMCDGSLGLLPCNHPEAQWFFNGANLISAYCFKMGFSSFMTVNEECSELSVMAADGGNDDLLRSQTFMLTEQDFIKTIVLASNGVGTTIPSEIGDSGPGGEIPSELGQLPSDVVLTGGGALLYPDNESGPAVEAKCDHTCDENKEVCAKHSSTEAGGKCYTKCSNDAKTGNGCETPGETCVLHHSHANGITSWCDCETDGKGEKWTCMAK